MRVDLLIRNGEVCSPPLRGRFDLGLRDGRVVVVAEAGSALQAQQVMDADGCLVLPGGVDPHVHLAIELGPHRTQHDYLTGTQAAAWGGTTTVIDFAFPLPGGTPLDAVAERHRRAQGQAVVDYGYHCVLTDADPGTLDAMRQLKEMGVPTFKLFLVYREMGLYVDDGVLAAILRETGRIGALPFVHAENEAMVSRATRGLLEAGQSHVRFYPLSRPAEAEAEAVGRSIALARQSGSPLYLVHTTSTGALEAIATARAAGQPVYGETCPHYLVLDESRYAEPNGERYVMSPPLRKPEDNEALWAAVADGRLTTVGSDDGSWPEGSKRPGRDDFTQAAPGIPGIETRLPLLYSGVRGGRLSLERMVELVASNPARICGLYPRKGTLQVGSDADMVVLDPDGETTITPQTFHMAVDYAPFQGHRLYGRIRHVLSRGSYVIRDANFVGQPGHGQFIARCLDEALLTRPLV